MPPTQQNEKQNENFFKELVFFIIIAVVIVVPIRTYIAQPFIVSGASMSPTFETGEYLIVDQISYRMDDPKRGDVIIFRYPNDPSQFFIKRIIGLPNEVIEIEGDKVYITRPGEERVLTNEPYIVFPRPTYEKTELEDDEYFVMGDNRLASSDSRVWGPLKKHFIIGRALLRLFPISKIDVKPGYNF